MTKITSLFALFSFVLLAQPGHISTNSIAVDSAGGIYAGTSASATISKLVGKVESWHVSLSSSPQDQVLALSLDAEGNVFAAGTLAQGGFIAKLSAGGERIGFASAPVPVRALAVGAGGAIYAGGAGYIQKFDTALRPDYRKNIAGSATGLAVDAAGILHAAIASPDGKALAIEFAGEGEVVSQLDLGPATPAAIIVDAAGSVYVTGSTASLDFPARNGFANHLNGPSDAFVVKIVNGAVEWSTYLGGRGDDTGTALAFDRSGNLVVAGYTTSCDFPGAGTGEPWHGGEDAFVTQFDGTGAVVQTTYAGTAGNDRALALVVDGQGNAHVSGWSKEQSQQPLMMSTRLKATQAPSLKVLQPRVVSTIVTTLADTGTGSLRDVVANVSAGSTITFQVTGTITLASRILINKNLTLSGPGAASLTISGGGTTRLFFIQSGTVAISGVTLANGFGKGGSSNAQTPGGGAAGMGGAIFQNGGSLAITSVVFDSNKAVGGNSNSVFVGNNSGGGGGFGGDAPTVSDVQPGGSGGDLGGTGGAANAGGTAGAGAGGGGGQSGSPGGNGGFGGGGGAANCGNAGDGGFGGGAGEGCNTSGTPGFGGGTASLILFSGAGGGAGFGGAIFVRSGTATIQQSTFENNQAIGGQSTGGVPGDNGQGKGGAVFAYQGSTVSISNSTFIGNIAAQAGVNSTNGYNGTSGGAKLCPGVDNTEICGTVSQTANVVQTSAIASGDNQTGATTRTFPIALAVRVTNSGTPASGVAVTFTVQPNGGASGTLVGGSTTLTVNTDNSGYATARLVANSTPGSFTVTAFGQTFHLTTAQCVNNPQVSVATDSVGSPATNSLRWAVNKACAGQTVTFAPAVTNVTLAGDTFNGRLRIDDNLTITGNGAAQTTVSGGDATRLFFIQSGNVAINNLTLSNGLGKGGDALQAQIDGGGAAGMGGAIFQNGGTVTVTGVVFASNKAVGGSTVLGSVGNQDGSGGGGGFGGNSVYSGANAGFGTGGSGGDLGGFGGDPGNITPGDGAGGGASGQIHPGADGGFGGGGGAANCGAGGNGGFGGGGGSDCGGTPGHGGFGGGNGISTLTFAMAGGGAGFGGAIFVRAGSLLVNSSSFSANQAIGGNLATSFAGQGKGGALFIYQGATVRLNNVTFSGSVAAEAGVNSPNAYDGTPQGAKLCPGADDVNICGSVKLTVGPPTLTGTVGVSYNSGVAITGGTPPFLVTLGSALPDGLTLTAATGAIAGIPTKAGVFTVPFSVADADISVGFTSTFTIAQGTQTITFAPLSDKVFGAAPFSVSATVSSGLAVTFSSLTPGVCTVAGSTVTLVNLGTCTIHATQIGSADYLPATPVDRSFQVLLAPPGSGQPFVTGQTTGTVRNNFSGFVGMQITVGTSPINVTKLGRIYLSGNNQTHTLKLVNVSTGADVAGGSVQLTMTAGTPNTYQYATLANAVQLLANTSYYLVSQESQGGDTWYDYTPITVTADAKVDGPVFQSGATYTQVTGSKNFSFVPPNFQYTVATVTPPPAVTITSPQANGTVSGQSVLLSATATAAPSLVITSVQFKVDADTLIGSAVTAPPYQVTWDSTTVPDGVHAITAVATDNTGGSTTSQPVQVNVSNGGVQAAGTEFVTSIPSSSLRSNYTGYVGMQFTVGPQNVTINGLGRVYVSGNSATHIVKLVDAANGQDVTGGSVSLNMTGGTAFKFKYAALASPLLLPAGTSYYLVSQETSGGDQWYDYGPVTSTNAASINGPVYLAGANYALVPAAVNQSFVPVSFLYSVNVAANTPPTVTITSPSAGMVSGTVAFNFTATASGGLTITSVQRKLDGVNFGSSIPGSSSTLSAGTPLDTTLLANGTHTLTGVATDSANNTATSAPVIITVNNAAPPSTAFITGQTFGTPRNNFSGFVGMQFTTGASTLSVTQLGRICVAGNSQAHNVKLVLAATGADVANGAVSIAMSGCTAGQYKYASLGSAVSLPANTAYYLVSQETSGGDQWYDYAPVTSSTGTVNGPVYFAGGYVSVQSPGSSFVPVNFQYNVSNTPPPTVSITTPAAGPVSGTITVTANAIATGGLTIQTVQFQLNNTNLGAPVSGAGPNYSVQLDTTTLINGSTYNLTAVATDSANNSSSSPAVAVTINNSVPPAGSPLIIGQSLGTLRNNFTGFVGMQFTTTATAIVANSLGRMCVAGNSGSHTLKLVKYDGTDLPGGTTTVNMAGCTPGQYKYASLTIPLQLNANTTYYLVSQEQTGGDQWYDYGPVTPAPGIATVNGPVYYTNIYNLVSSPGYSYVPVNLLYQ